jgi:hypothetical protein
VDVAHERNRSLVWAAPPAEPGALQLPPMMHGKYANIAQACKGQAKTLQSAGALHNA